MFHAANVTYGNRSFGKLLLVYCRTIYLLAWPAPWLLLLLVLLLLLLLWFLSLNNKTIHTWPISVPSWEMSSKVHVYLYIRLFVMNFITETVWLFVGNNYMFYLVELTLFDWFTKFTINYSVRETYSQIV